MTKWLLLLFNIIITNLLLCAPSYAQVITGQDWNETAVRKILHTFAYGGQATDTQITTWTQMNPRDAIREILIFDPTNEKLSPPEDDTSISGGTLTGLQSFWSSDSTRNPMREDRRRFFPLLHTTSDGTTSWVSDRNFQNTWIHAVNKRGLNPFRQKTGLWLTNYHMAVSLNAVKAHQIRKMYDDVMGALSEGRPFHEVLTVGATSAAIARLYGHQFNTFNNEAGTFRGNDDFAREYHQLFFQILGENEDPDYHENTTIEHTAWTLTGMGLDYEPNAFGSPRRQDWWLDSINFTDHTDNSGNDVANFSNHYAGDLEILHQTIQGNTAEEKLQNLSRIAIAHPESQDNIPVSIVNFFADDNLNDEKIAAIRTMWRRMDPPNLLEFLREYAISSIFHQEGTFKYRTSFQRNLTIYNLNTVDNTEAYFNTNNPFNNMFSEGEQVFRPAHNVFGGQTSLDAANNPNIFKVTYNRTVNLDWYLSRSSESYTDDNGEIHTWDKDWSRVIPSTRVDLVAEWLWQRFIADGGKNYGLLERAYVTGFLATGMDFGYLVDNNKPDLIFSSVALGIDSLQAIIKTNEASQLKLNSTDIAERREANRRVGMAVSFITLTPYMFAMEGR